ncbi:tight adherence protein B [Micromonospora eburnea]|uniref:Tight adherence protein B n=1 Tax=Micromonospora eburnea TaxID=227316 RepID=A0A1C6TRE3_9ACTN|nr:tight adherence protein B [Micromonospora eburnea]
MGGRRPRAALSLSPTSTGAAVTWSVGGTADPAVGGYGPAAHTLGGAPPGTHPVGPVASGSADARAVDQVRRAPTGDRRQAGPTDGQVQRGPVTGLFRVPGLLAAPRPARLPTDGVAVRGRLLERVGVAVSRRGLLPAVLMGGGTGAVLGGPVAAIVLAAYGALAARAARRRSARRQADQARRRELDQLCALAADLRAGLPVEGVVADGPHRIARLGRAAVRLADRTGAPLAELLERVEADARAADRGLAAAAAQAAGARATAWLLAALPLGGIGLGYAIGVDPVAVLLHTTVGGGSALAAVALQVGGLLWAERLGATPGRHD